MSKYFERYIKVAPFSHSMWRANEANLVSSVEIKKPLIDLGCGFGEFGGVFYDYQVEVGVDISPKDLELARGKEIYSKVVWASAAELPFENDFFATSISISTLEHIKNPKKVLEEVYRVLKEGGKFIYTVPTSTLNKNLIGQKIFKILGFPRLAEIYIRAYHKVFSHETIVDKSAWLEWTKESGFKHIEVVNTMSPEHVRFFELFLLTAAPSQILRWVSGKRHVLNFATRTKVLTKLYNFLNSRNKNSFDSSNILVVATK